jgi:hypothetical protein
VSTVFLSLPDLAGPDDLSRLAPIVRASVRQADPS